MPVYKIHGFPWPRGGIPSVRVFIVLENLDDAAAEYIQQKKTSDLILGAIRKNHPDAVKHLPNLQLIEQYDPLDMTDAAVSQPYAFVADNVTVLPDTARPVQGLSMNIDQRPLDDVILSDAHTALAEIRDAIAPGQKIGWWIVYNGDPERYYPGMEDDLMEDEDDDINYQSRETGPSSVATSAPVKVPEIPADTSPAPGLKKKRSFWRRK
ncbi:conserved hypothetical protein [Talaromyces stipitatus ATCC 10500]|uniref:Developmental regulator FlbE n=1 Tax=Talaromyces stipitatus (strain ATCC 10500 / CBS 375.48 / QM 6759 / NRRL 1006) TaxID=441959 RepID=B8M3D4_TALSN|nr:uncharacterized protein TSTA_095550 [Talaromyces stipitatus ATCC 10500]EED22306.1 conserved hypothetical protein [Talaromyces stipitatus ATCC 10500]